VEDCTHEVVVIGNEGAARGSGPPDRGVASSSRCPMTEKRNKCVLHRVGGEIRKRRHKTKESQKDGEEEHKRRGRIIRLGDVLETCWATWGKYWTKSRSK